MIGSPHPSLPPRFSHRKLLKAFSLGAREHVATCTKWRGGFCMARAYCITNVPHRRPTLSPGCAFSVDHGVQLMPRVVSSERSIARKHYRVLTLKRIRWALLHLVLTRHSSSQCIISSRIDHEQISSPDGCSLTMTTLSSSMVIYSADILSIGECAPPSCSWPQKLLTRGGCAFILTRAL